jgi:hypothetical protein
MRLVGLSLVLAALACAACGGGSATPEPVPQPAGISDFAALNLPSPGELPVRQGMAVIVERPGGSFYHDPFQPG